MQESSGQFLGLLMARQDCADDQCAQVALYALGFKQRGAAQGQGQTEQCE